VIFARDTELSLQAAVSLVNSAVPPDKLTWQAELEDFWTRFAFTGRHDRDEAELAAVRRLRRACARCSPQIVTTQWRSSMTYSKGWALPRSSCGTTTWTGTCTSWTPRDRWPNGSPQRARWR